MLRFASGERQDAASTEAFFFFFFLRYLENNFSILLGESFSLHTLVPSVILVPRHSGDKGHLPHSAKDCWTVE